MSINEIVLISELRKIKHQINDVSDKLDAANASGQIDWIDVDDHYPKADDLLETNMEDCTQYLVYRKCGIMDVCNYIKVCGEPFFVANAIEIKDVTHWAKLQTPNMLSGGKQECTA